MLFGSLFKGEKGIAAGRRKRKLTVSDVIGRLDQYELTTANCTLIRDDLGNEKVENYGQVDVFRVRDEKIYMHDNGFCITTLTGTKLKTNEGNSGLAEMVSVAPDRAETASPESEAEEEDGADGGKEGEDPFKAASKEGGQEEDPFEAAEAEDDPIDPDTIDAPAKPVVQDAFSDGGGRREKEEIDPEEIDPSELALEIGQVIRLRFFFNRIPYELDCQIVDRFHSSQIKDIDLTPPFGVGYQVRPLTDVKNRDQRRYIRYTHKVGFGPLRMRNEIQFQVYMHRTNLETPEKGAINPMLTFDDFSTIPFGDQEVSEVKGAKRPEEIVEFFMNCMVNNPTERRHVYPSKPFFSDKTRRSTLEGLGYYNTVGSQQATILPKIFIKKPLKGKTVLERRLAERGKGAMDSHKLRILEEIQDRYQLLTRELKIWQVRRRKKRMENFENDMVLVGFSSNYGIPPNDLMTTRQMTMQCELIDVGVENMTLKPISFDDARSREADTKEYVRQEDGFQADLLNFSVGGVELRGGDTEEQNDAFLKYLVGDNYDELNLADRIEAMRQYAVMLHFYPVLNFVRSQIQEFEPWRLPFKIPVIARVARIRIEKSADDDEPKIVSLGLEFIYNPTLDAYARDLNLYDQWEKITPYTENQNFIEVHKSLQLLFGFDRALDDEKRDGIKKQEADPEEEKEAVEEAKQA